ncbi:MAG: hypothetical protein HYS13_24935 [Planctomycetia bacterium]|nr:hypothetical protein [Planctomycetia bacterium]
MFRALKLAIVPAVLVLGLGLLSANSAKAHEPGCPGYGYGGHYGYDDFPSHRVYDVGGAHYGADHGYGRGGRVHVHPQFDVHHGHVHGGIVIHGRFGAFNINW